jgi:hypothetical protein
LQFRPEEIGELEALAVDLVTDPALLRSDQLQIWQGVARLLIRGHAREIARTAFAAHRGGPGLWYLPGSPAEEVLVECIGVDPQGVWAELTPFLENPAGLQGFVTNLPSGLVDRFPQEPVLSWSSVSPDRAPVLACLADPNFQSDLSLAARLAELHGHRDDVSRAIFGQMLRCFDGGLRSEHWAEYATNLERVVGTTSRASLRR